MCFDNMADVSFLCLLYCSNLVLNIRQWYIYYGEYYGGWNGCRGKLKNEGAAGEENETGKTKKGKRV